MPTLRKPPACALSTSIVTSAPALWDVYGFRNAFNETEDWYATGELALNQGPQTVMIENGRTALVWRSFMSNPEMPAMQKKIGLMPDKDQ